MIFNNSRPLTAASGSRLVNAVLAIPRHGDLITMHLNISSYWQIQYRSLGKSDASGAHRA
jgi:hypothetical protein